MRRHPLTVNVARRPRTFGPLVGLLIVCFVVGPAFGGAVLVGAAVIVVSLTVAAVVDWIRR